MSQDSNNSSKLKGEIVSIAKEVAASFYKDAISPASKEVGKSLEIIAKTINAALSPLKAFVWGYDRVENFLKEKFPPKMINIPPEKIITPKVNIAVPTIEALRYIGSNQELSELFLNLLATSMDSDSAKNAHPAFVTIIKEMTSDEAKILKAMAIRYNLRGTINFPVILITPYVKGNPQVVFEDEIESIHDLDITLDHPELISIYIDNLFRLGLIGRSSPKPEMNKIYNRLEESEEAKNAINKILKIGNREYNLRKQRWTMIRLCREFCKACIIRVDMDD